MANESLASELEGLLAESGPTSPFDTVTDRIGRIFGMLDEMADDDGVSQVLESAWDSLDNSLTEDMDEGAFLDAVTPALRVIKRCMESIDEGSFGGPKNVESPA